jgi:uncharacterized membrane protein (DUF485 family)
MVEPVYISRHCPEMAPMFIVLLTMFIVFVSLIAIAIKILIFCKIFSQAGYSWALGLLMLVPIANIIMAFFLAFADWPVCKELRKLKQQLEKSKA